MHYKAHTAVATQSNHTYVVLKTHSVYVAVLFSRFLYIAGH